MSAPAFPGVSISDRVIATNGRASGFDYLRFCLAATVIFFHAIVTSSGVQRQSELMASPFGLAVEFILPMFFALSGFLIAGSLERSRSIGVFLGLRVMRIFPALAVDTLLCALILGPLLTTLPLSGYLAHPEFQAYLLNTLGMIHFTLPGVFQDNPSNIVNGQLWTIPIELECYTTITILALCTLHRHRNWMLGMVGAGLVAMEARVMLGYSVPWAGRLLLMCFLCGILFYQFRDRIKLHPIGLVGAIIASVVCLRNPSLTYLCAVSMTYITVFLGLQNPRKSSFLESGDYSYGLFLYGFPLQQVLVQFVPWCHTWYWNIALALPLALLFSMLSWHLIEKRVLARKPLLFAAHARCMAIVARTRVALFPPAPPQG